MVSSSLPPDPNEPEVEQLIRDVELVMSQADVAGPEAVAALRMHGGDIVNAIMSLTM